MERQATETNPPSLDATRPLQSGVRVGYRHFLRRGVGVAAVVAGIAMALSPFALSLAGNANGGQRILDRFRYTLSTGGLAALKSSYTTVVNMGDEFFGRTLPYVRAQLHESPATFQADLARRYPAIATAEKEIPPVLAIVNPRVPGLLVLHDDFAKVDSLPFLGLPVSSVPWILLGVGIAIAALGVAVLVRPSRAGAALVSVIGLGLIVVPLALSVPSKADAAVRLQQAGRFVFSPMIAPAALATTQKVDRLVGEVSTSFVPQTAARLHETPAQLSAQLAHRFPAVARGLAAWPSIRSGALQRASDQVASVRDFANVEGIDVRAVPWAVIGPGILMLLVGAIALGLGRDARRPD
jgi:hypothetical protein